MDTPAGSTSGQSATPDRGGETIELPAKLRVHALAKMLGSTSREVIKALDALGEAVRSAQSNITRDVAVRVVQEMNPELLEEPDSGQAGSAQAETEQTGAAQPGTERAGSAQADEPTSGVPAAPAVQEDQGGAAARTDQSAADQQRAEVFTPTFAAPEAMFLAPEPVQPKAAPKGEPEPESGAEPGADSAPESGSRTKSAEKAQPKAEQRDAGEDTGSQSEQDDGADTDDGDEDSDQGNRRRRRRGRRGRGRGRGGDGEHDESESEQSDGTDETTKGTDEQQTGQESSDEDTGEEADSGGEPNRRRRRRRRRKGGGDDDSGSNGNRDDDPPNTVVHVRESAPEGRQDKDKDKDNGGSSDDEVRSVKGSTRLEAKRQRRRDGRDAGRRRTPVLSESEFLARRESVDRRMVVRQSGEQTQIAVLEDNVLVENFVTSSGSGSLVGNVYLGRVQNVLPSMEAAFVDIGRGRNAVLYAGEVNWSAAGLAGKSRRIEQALQTGDSVLVQVTKDPVGHKGARLTTQVSLPGRFLVYVPGGGATGISRKLPDNERKRLKDILKRIVPDNSGVIIRTASEGTSEEALDRDVRRLEAQWEVIKEKSESSKKNAPELLYEEPDLLIKVVRDLFTEDFSAMTVQGDQAWETIEAYVQHVAPDLMERLHKHVGKNDVFVEQRVNEQISKALDRKVWLPSGGYLVIDRTEAMTVIDVNTGKFTGSGGNLEETVTRNNLEAAEEVVRQLRLRDVGGIIVIDFIDMVLEANRDLVLRRLTECLGRDRTRHQVAEVTSLGLVQMTRKRVGTGLLEAYSSTCEHCRGRGLLVSTDSHGHGNGGSSGNGGNGNSRRNRRGKNQDSGDSDQRGDKQDSGKGSDSGKQDSGKGSGKGDKHERKQDSGEQPKSDSGKPQDVDKSKDSGKDKDVDKSKDSGKDKDVDKSKDADKSKDVSKPKGAEKSQDAGKPRDSGKPKDSGKDSDKPRGDEQVEPAGRPEAEIAGEQRPEPVPAPAPAAGTSGDDAGTSRGRRKVSRPAGGAGDTGPSAKPMVVAKAQESEPAAAAPQPAVEPATSVVRRASRRAASRPAGSPTGGSAQESSAS